MLINKGNFYKSRFPMCFLYMTNRHKHIVALLLKTKLLFVLKLLKKAGVEPCNEGFQTKKFLSVVK